MGPSNIYRYLQRINGPIWQLTDSYFDFLRKGIKADYAISNEVLGEGKFAIVKKAIHRQSGEEVAVKIIFKQRIKKNKV
jgi:serine/threonine protein kinase